MSEVRAIFLTSSLSLTALLSACPQLSRGPETTRVVVSLRAAEAEAVGKAVVVVEGAVAKVKGVRSVRSVGCASGGVVVVEGAAGADPVTAVHEALSAQAAALPVGISPLRVTGLAHDVRLLSVRGADPFTARAFVDTQLLAALKAVPGVSDVIVSGGRRERQLRIDPERLLAADISLPEVLTSIRTASDLDKTVIKLTADGARILLRDVSVTETGSAGEPVRKDGGVEVRIRGDHNSGGEIDDVIEAVDVPGTLFVASLDADSVEVVTLLVSRDSGDLQQQQGDPVVAAAADNAVDAAYSDVAAAALGIPGVHTFRRGRSLQLTLDRKRLDALGLSSGERAALADVTAIATSGLVIETRQGPLRVLLGTAATPEALLSTRVASRRVGIDTVPVRLFDVARAAFIEEQRSERVDLRPARRLRLSFDVGVRKPALADLDTRLAAIRQARPGISILVERDDDTAPLDAICP